MGRVALANRGVAVKAFYTEGTEYTKAVGQERAWCPQGSEMPSALAAVW